MCCSSVVDAQEAHGISLADRLGFSRFSNLTYDRATKMFGVGYNSSFPEELIRGIVAAEISVVMGCSAKSAEKYLPVNPYSRPERFDVVYFRQLSDRIDRPFRELIKLNEAREAHLGEAIADSSCWSAYSVWKEAFKLADIGCLYEVMALCRLALEQLAWANKANHVEDGDEVLEIRAQGSIGNLKEVIPFSGRLYGWLSEHSHWYPHAHIKSVGSRGEKLITVTHCIDFKAQSYVALTLVAYCIESVLFKVLNLRGSDCPSVDRFFYQEQLSGLRGVVTEILDDSRGALAALDELSSLLEH